MQLPSRKQLTGLGPKSTDLEDLDCQYKDEKTLAIEGAIKMLKLETHWRQME